MSFDNHLKDFKVFIQIHGFHDCYNCNDKIAFINISKVLATLQLINHF